MCVHSGLKNQTQANLIKFLMKIVRDLFAQNMQSVIVKIRFETKLRNYGLHFWTFEKLYIVMMSDLLQLSFRSKAVLLDVKLNRYCGGQRRFYGLRQVS